MKRIFSLILALTAICAFGCSAPESDGETPTATSGTSASEVMDIYAFSIGKADSLLLTFDGKTLLIDAGENDDGEDIAKALLAKGISSIDLLLITHFDKDHIGGFDELAALIEINQVWMPDYERDSNHYRNMMEIIEQESIPCERISENLVAEFGSANLELWPSTVEYTGADNDDNEQSLVMAVNYGNCRLLFMGDANGEWLNRLCYGTYNLTCDLVKIPWHGSWDATLTAFIAFSLPQFAIITDSTKNPADEATVDALSAIGTEIYRTMNGDVHLRCDGQSVYQP
ncbi:MAG: MBL fold metallo-hydrolase [Clostridia bacterium]|nr:MBL fold metallo-hydrolase [Clostridia bacterium]